MRVKTAQDTQRHTGRIFFVCVFLLIICIVYSASGLQRERNQAITAAAQTSGDLITQPY